MLVSKFSPFFWMKESILLAILFLIRHYWPSAQIKHPTLLELHGPIWFPRISSMLVILQLPITGLLWWWNHQLLAMAKFILPLALAVHYFAVSGTMHLHRGPLNPIWDSLGYNCFWMWVAVNHLRWQNLDSLQFVLHILFSSLTSYCIVVIICTCSFEIGSIWAYWLVLLSSKKIASVCLFLLY